MQLVPAFVLRNYIPEKHKVVILHKHLGKISCVYTKKDAAMRLCTGSLLLCAVEKKKNWYEIVQIDVLMVPSNCSLQDITFFHEIILLCLKNVPTEVNVSELFDYLWYVFTKFDGLTDVGRQVVVLRLFLMFDLAPEELSVYHLALQDPYGEIESSEQQLSGLLSICWKRFYQQSGNLV